MKKSDESIGKRNLTTFSVNYIRISLMANLSKIQKFVHLFKPKKVISVRKVDGTVTEKVVFEAHHH